jgi:hypothetical protein
MTAYEIYKQASEKAREIDDVVRALQQIHPADVTRLSSMHSIITFLGRGLTPECEREWKKDERRAVKLLYKDYCTLRDELRAMLSAEYDAR